MDFTVTIDFWLLISLCLFFMLMGLMLKVNNSGRNHDRHHY